MESEGELERKKGRKKDDKVRCLAIMKYTSIEYHLDNPCYTWRTWGMDKIPPRHKPP